MQRFDNQIVLVTGGGTGIGRAIAKRFSVEGATVYLAGRRGMPIEEAAEEILQIGGRARALTADVSRKEDVDRVVATIKEEQGHLDILVNAAGILRMGLIHETNEEDFDAMFGSNVRGLWMMTRQAIPLLIGRPNPNIIHISSTGAKRADVGLGLYEASKAAVNVITRVMAKELAKQRIRVNAIAPGPVDTEFFAGSVLGDDVRRKTLEELISAVPFGRMGTADEVARLAVFLASPESDFISGSVTSIDGALGV